MGRKNYCLILTYCKRFGPLIMYCLNVPRRPTFHERFDRDTSVLRSFLFKYGQKRWWYDRQTFKLSKYSGKLSSSRFKNKRLNCTVILLFLKRERDFANVSDRLSCTVWTFQTTQLPCPHTILDYSWASYIPQRFWTFHGRCWAFLV